MMRPSRSSQGGFTLVDVIAAAVLASTLLASASSFLGTTTGLVEGEQVRLEAVRNLRDGLEAVSNVLRAAELTTLSGFDDDGFSTAPSFQRVTGAEDWEPGVLALGQVESIEWRAGTTTVPGIDQPGAVWLVSPEGDRMLAPDVPAGAFLVRQQGRGLAVRLGSYAGRRAGSTTDIERWVVVSLRNSP